MKINRSVYSTAAAAALAVAALGATGAAQAGDVFWSLGLSSPGVAVGVANAPPVYVAPQPVYVQPQPVYVQPRPVYVQPAPVYYQSAPPVYYRPAPVYQAGYVVPGTYHWPKRHGWDRNGNGIPDRQEFGHWKHDRHGDRDD